MLFVGVLSMKWDFHSLVCKAVLYSDVCHLITFVSIHNEKCNKPVESCRLITVDCVAFCSAV